MYKIVRVSKRAGVCMRTFLSEAYRCTESWQSRLQSPVLQKVRLDELAYSLDQKLQRKDPVSPVDMDVFANALRAKDESNLNELRDLLHRFRLTKETGDMLDSTGYAAIRHFIDTDKLDDLIEMLDDRINYGLFLDDFTGSMLLDILIERKNFVAAAKVASLFMLQEDFNNEITDSLCLYACYKYISLLEPEEPAPKVEEPVKKKKEEEIKVRVRYLINPYFDDHFDLRDLKLLTGKTLWSLTSTRNDIFGLNCQLIGLLFYKKKEKFSSVLHKIAKDGLLYEETLKIVELALQQNHIREDAEMLPACTQLLEDLKKVKWSKEVGNMEEMIVKRIQDALNKRQEEHIHNHSRVIEEWEKVRQKKFQEQVERIEVARELAEQKAREEKLRDIEEKLWFLENEEKVDMKIEENEKLIEEHNKKYPKKTVAKDEEYIPPEIKPTSV